MIVLIIVQLAQLGLAPSLVLGYHWTLKGKKASHATEVIRIEIKKKASHATEVIRIEIKKRLLMRPRLFALK